MVVTARRIQKLGTSASRATSTSSPAQRARTVAIALKTLPGTSQPHSQFTAGAESQVVRALHTTPVTQLQGNATRNKENIAWAAKGNIKYQELKPITESPSGKVTIIDVREPLETSQGMIPSAVNVPLSEFSTAFKTGSGGGDFSKKYAFDRPDYDAPLVFYCRSGKRSAQAIEEAKKGGWKNVRNYEGSWLDWQAQEKSRGQNDD